MTIERSWFIAGWSRGCRWGCGRTESSEIDAADPDRAVGKQFVGPARLLRDLEAGLAEMADLDGDVDDIVEPRRRDDSAATSR